MQRTRADPELKREVKDRFEELLATGSYGCRRQLTKGSVMQMCKDNKMCK